MVKFHVRITSAIPLLIPDAVERIDLKIHCNSSVCIEQSFPQRC